MKGSNDKLCQCEYNLQENLGSKMQFSVTELWSTEISRICIFQDKEDTFISSCEEYSRRNTSTEVNIGHPQVSLLWQEIWQLWFTYTFDGYSSPEKKKA